MNHDYIPGGDAEFDEFQTVFITDATSNGDGWGIPIEAVTGIRIKGVRWNEAYAKTGNARDRTHADVVEKNEARADYEREIRKFVKGYIAFNPKITDAERDKPGLNIPTGHRSPAPVPTTIPTAEIDFSISLRHTVHFRDSLADGRAKPEKVHGCEIWSKIGGEAPVTERDLTYAGTDTRSPFVIPYGFEQQGKTAYYRLRWVNTRGEAGPWSAPVSAIIA